MDHYDLRSKRTIQEKTFKYRLIPLDEVMEETAIYRQNTVDKPTKPTDWTVHCHPFSTLPLLESHLHPKFVIYETGRKLDDILCPLRPLSEKKGRDEEIALVEEVVARVNEGRRQFRSKLRKTWPAITQIEHIYAAWTHNLDTGFNPSSPSSDDDGSDDDNDNETNRTGPRNVKRRRYNIYNESPTRQPSGKRNADGGRRQRKSTVVHSDSCTLTGKALRNLEKCMDKAGWSEEAILAWSTSTIHGADLEEVC